MKSRKQQANQFDTDIWGNSKADHKGTLLKAPWKRYCIYHKLAQINQEQILED